MNGIYLYFVNKRLSSWALLGLLSVCQKEQDKNATNIADGTTFNSSPDHRQYCSVILYFFVKCVMSQKCIENAYSALLLQDI